MGQPRRPKRTRGGYAALIFDAEPSIDLLLPLVALGHVIAPRTALAIACRVILEGSETLARSEHVGARLAESHPCLAAAGYFAYKTLCTLRGAPPTEIGVPRSCVVSVPYGPRPAPMIASASIQACDHCETLSPLMRCCSVVSAVFRISRAGCQSPSFKF